MAKKKVKAKGKKKKLSFKEKAKKILNEAEGMLFEVSLELEEVLHNAEDMDPPRLAECSEIHRMLSAVELANDILRGEE